MHLEGTKTKLKRDKKIKIKTYRGQNVKYELFGFISVCCGFPCGF